MFRFSPVDLAVASAKASAGARIGHVQCGVGVCRIELEHKDARALGAYPRALADAGGCLRAWS